MLIKCYLNWQGCSCDFQRLKAQPLGVPKPCRTFCQDASSLLMKSTFCEKTPVWYIGIIHDIAFWALSKAYVSKCRNITRYRRNMVYSAFESWSFIFLNFEKTFVIRTHPEELRVVKCAHNTRISTHFYPQWGQPMLTKYYLQWQGCSCAFQWLKLWHLGVPKPYRTSSYDVSLLLTRSTICVISWILWKSCGFIHKRKTLWFYHKW